MGNYLSKKWKQAKKKVNQATSWAEGEWNDATSNFMEDANVATKNAEHWFYRNKTPILGTVGTVVGATAGFMLGGPAGAVAGASLLGGGAMQASAADDQARELRKAYGNLATAMQPPTPLLGPSFAGSRRRFDPALSALFKASAGIATTPSGLTQKASTGGKTALGA